MDDENKEQEDRRRQIALSLTKFDQEQADIIFLSKENNIGILKIRISDEVNKREIASVVILNKRLLKMMKMVTIVSTSAVNPEGLAFSTELPWTEFIGQVYSYYEKKRSDDKQVVFFNNDFASGFNINNITQLVGYAKDNSQSAISSEITNIIQHTLNLSEIHVAADGEAMHEIDYEIYIEDLEKNRKQEVHTKIQSEDAADALLKELAEKNEKKGRAVVNLQGTIPISPAGGYPLTVFRPGDRVYVKLFAQGEKELEILRRLNAYNEQTGKVERIDGIISDISISPDNKYSILVEITKHGFLRCDLEGTCNLAAPEMPSQLAEEEESREKGKRIKLIALFVLLGFTLVAAVIFLVF